MAERWRQTFRMHRGYWPAQAYTGGANETIFRGRNVVFQGGPETVYAEVFPGHEAIYTIPESGAVDDAITLHCTQGSTLVTTSALIQFLILPGFLLTIDRRLYIVTAIESAGDSMGGTAQFRISPPFQSPTALPAGSDFTPFLIPSTIHTTNQVLALMRGGGSIQGLPKGHFYVVGASMFFNVGDHAVRLLPGKYGGGLTTGTFRIAGQNPGLLNFEPTVNATVSGTALTVGFDAPIISTLTEGPTLGVKNMPPGTYSLRIARARTETGGYGPLSEAKQIVITKEGGKMQLTFPLPQTVVATGQVTQNSWQVFGSLFSVAEGVTGPWYQIREVLETEVV